MRITFKAQVQNRYIHIHEQRLIATAKNSKITSYKTPGSRKSRGCFAAAFGNLTKEKLNCNFIKNRHTKL